MEDRMKRFLLKSAVLFMALTLSYVHLTPDFKEALPKTTLDGSQLQRVSDFFNELPSHFIENKGQFGNSVRYRLTSPEGKVDFSTGAIIYNFLRKEKGQDQFKGGREARGVRDPREFEEGKLQMKYIGSNEAAAVEATKETDTKMNFYLGSDPEKWVTGARTFRQICYKELYPHIDLVVEGSKRRIKQSYIISPGGDTADIIWKYEGAKELKINEEGQLEIVTERERLTEEAPLSYQYIDGEMVGVKTDYVVDGDQNVRFKVGAYRKDLDIIIDPWLVFSTYVGTTGTDEGRGIAVDENGDIFITGVEYSSAPSEIFVTRFSLSSTWMTWIGGSYSDECYAIALDASGNPHIAGKTWSTDFPISTWAADSLHNGKSDVFITKFDTNLSMVYSTFLGGSDEECAYGLAVRGDWAYVTGDTWSSDFYTSYDAYDDTFDGTTTDAFVSIVDTSGVSPRIPGSTFLGGTSDECGYGITVDANGIYVTGYTNSSDFPAKTDSATYSVYDSSHNGGKDVFVTRLLQWCHGIYFSTYFGGSGDDVAYGIGVTDPDVKWTNDFFITGETGSSDFPTTAGAYDRTLGYHDAFVTRFHYKDDYLVHSTYLGGSSSDASLALAVDELGNAYVTGNTTSSDFPMTGDAYDKSYNSGPYDAFITKINPSGSSLLYSTYFGGSANDYGSAIAVDDVGSVHIIGKTASPDFPTTANPPFIGPFGYWDVFVSKFRFEGSGCKFSYSGSWTGAGHGEDGWYVGDFDKDGLDDIFRYVAGVSGAQVFLSDGTKFNFSGSWTGAGHGTDGWYVGDFNGDGRDDIFRYVAGVSGAQVFLSDGAKFNYNGSWTGAGHGTDGWYVGDFNGDGRDDIFRYIPGVSGADMFLSDGAKFNYNGSWTGAGHGTDGWYAGDFDGDGKDDIFRYAPSVSGAQVFLSDGAKFNYNGSWTGAGHGTDGWYIGDFDGDGRDDIFRYLPGVSGASMFLSDGTRFVNSGSWTGAGHGADGWYIGNFDGDGDDDIFRYLPGVSGADVFLAVCPWTASFPFEMGADLEFDEHMMSDVNGSQETEMSAQEEAEFIAPFEERVKWGEEVSIFEIKNAYEEKVGEVVRLIEVRRLLHRHGWWDLEARFAQSDDGEKKIKQR
jgi:hypothetical protein